MHKISLVLLAICMQASDIRISEVMSNPQGSEYENEFIEIYNPSDHVIYINGWILSDGNGIDTLTHLSGPLGILPINYGLILDPGYSFELGPYLDLIPDSTPIYTLATDASFGSGGLANSGESVIIYNPDTSEFSQMSWSSASDNGFSWERVSLDTPDSLAVWQQALVENGTPGFRNSVSRPQRNLSLNTIEVTRATAGESIEVRVTVHNSGEQSIPGFNLSVYRDENQNEIYDDGEWELSLDQSIPLESDQVFDLTVVLFIMEPGIHQIEMTVSAEGDENASDDTLRFEVLGAYPPDIVSITEIMSSPALEQGGEWIEIQNLSGNSVSLQGWTLSDANQTRHKLVDSLLQIEVNGFITLCAQPEAREYFSLIPEQALVLNSWPTLNSASDSIRLFDATGQLVARAFYRGSWGSPAISLERRHPSLFPLAEWNWAASEQPDGGTPSMINTQQLESVAIQIETITAAGANLIGPASVPITLWFRNVGLDPLQSLQIETHTTAEWQGLLTSFQTDSMIISSHILAAGISTVSVNIYHEQVLLADTALGVILGFPPKQLALNEIHYLPSV
ncbi:MAG: lamin tail domain-containing protein, partial [Candidatus Marinimicrobia bacterium]|nr:lamin tail domain-containing protein [Candidatus Neomarinimicrobiota bacterium]